MDRRVGDRGQILVIFAGGLVALLAIAALVIDLGMVVMIQRQERSAADPGALAAARYIRFPSTGDTTKMFGAACFYARQNGFFDAATDNSNGANGCVQANDSYGSTMAIHFPPSGAAGQFAGRPGFVEVTITRPHNSFLAGVLGITSIPVTSSAVAAFNDGDSNSNSLVVLDPDDCGALTVTGTGDLVIAPATGVTGDGGHVMVNSNCPPGTDATPNACASGGSGGAVFSGGGDITAPHLYVVGSCKDNGTGSVNFATGITEDANFYGDPMAGLMGPAATGPGAFCEPLGRALVPGDNGCQYSGNTLFTVSPGVFYGGIKVNTPNVKLNLLPGIYIMAGGGFNPANGTVESTSGDLLIYSTDVEAYRGANCLTTAPSVDYCQGDIVINGNVQIDLSGLAVDPCPPVSSVGCPYVGLLFWQERTASKALAGTAEIRINGGSNLQLSGTVYNAAGHVQINGGSATTGCSGTNQNCLSIQVIANTVTINGNSDVFMPYDPAGLYRFDNKGLVR